MSEKFLKDLSTSLKDSEDSDDEIIKTLTSIYTNYYTVNYRPYSDKEETENVEILLDNLNQFRENFPVGKDADEFWI